jgi:hypothetical protein
LYALLESLFETVKGAWEDLFERRYGFWRGLLDGVVADIGHAQWVFTVPKLLRPYFMHHRELLGPLCAAAWQTVRELMAVAAGEEKDFRPGMVAVVQTFGDQLNLHPHVYALVTRDGWTASGEWVPVPYVSSSAAEQLFRHKVIRLLQHAGLLDEDRTRLLLSWHHSGFSVHNFVTVPAGDGRAFEALYFVARLLAHDPDPRRHLVHYYGAYSNVVRGKLKARDLAQKSEPLAPGPGEDAPPPACTSPSLAALRRGSAQLLRRVYEVDPLACPRCRGVMRVVSFITEGRVIRRILDHLGASARRATQERAPPPAAAAVPDSP